MPRHLGGAAHEDEPPDTRGVIDSHVEGHRGAVRLAEDVGLRDLEIVEQRDDVVGQQLDPQRPVDVCGAAVGLEVEADTCRVALRPGRVAENEVPIAEKAPCSSTSGTPPSPWIS